MTIKPRILVVEDQALLLLDLVDQLNELGFDAVPASSARSAAHLLNARFDALVTDIELGDGPNGLTLARLAHGRNPAMPIVVVSGGVTPRARDLPHGARFVPKPYRIEHILSALEQQTVAHAA
ncbi:MAG: response regulator [Devosia sp.]|uniref:response regulator n=1 Tax=Devosia sp. TaxID=1871048 RepID=UPI0024C664A1|nr:response regulator [Devosia sp.]UYO00949.1 MAG: response regulator [Devosia sp.]